VGNFKEKVFPLKSGIASHRIQLLSQGIFIQQSSSIYSHT